MSSGFSYLERQGGVVLRFKWVKLAYRSCMASGLRIWGFEPQTLRLRTVEVLGFEGLQFRGCRVATLDRKS